MKFFDRDFLKMAFQFVLIIFLGVVVVSFVSGVKMERDATAVVVDGK